MIVALALSSRIATPVTRLVAAARRIAGGHYAERVPASGEGEIGELAATFNAMAGSLEATERRRLELVGDVAHELRTPLATLDGYLEGLQDGVVEPDPETWTLLRRETGRLTRLVDDLSELWRAEARQLPLSIEELDAGQVAGDVVEQFRPQAESRSLTIATDLAGRPPSSGPIATGSPRSSATTSRTRSATAPTVPRSTIDGDGRGERGRRLGSRPRARASRPSSAPTCSSASTGSTRRARARSAGPGSASRSSGRSPTRWAGAPGRSPTGPGAGSTFSVALPAA